MLTIQRRKIMRVSRTMAVALLGLTLATGPSKQSEAALDCADLLTGGNYLCDFKSNTGLQGAFCTQFANDAPPFNVFFPVDNTDLRCACQASGTFAKPKFGAGKAFLCGDNGDGDAMSGTVSSNGQRITGGQYLERIPFRTWVFECEKVPAC
jgi:hypothetical protein